MLTVIGLMFGGVILGYLFRGKKMKWIGQVVMVLIWLLLFLLGVDVGVNQDIMNGLHTIGIEALIITLAAVLGSVLGAKLLWKWIKGNDKRADYEE